MSQNLQTAVIKNKINFSGSFRKNTDKGKTKMLKTFIFQGLLMLFFLSSAKGFAQLNESFDSGIPGTWTLFGNAVSNIDWSTTTDGYLGTNGVSINPALDNIGDQNTAQYYLVTPQIAVPENGEIQFYTKQGSDIDNGSQYQIRLSTAAQPDINGFNVVLQSYTESNLNIGSQTQYEKKIVEIPSSIPVGLNIYVAFVAVNTQNGATPTGDEWFVDEVAILEGCVEVLDEDVTIDQITVNSAQVSWSHPTASNFEIQVLPTGGIPADSGIPVTGTSYSLASLDDDTEYDIYISALCDNDTQSAWTGPYTFKTLKFGLSCDFPIELTDVTSAPYVLTDNLENWVNPDEVYSTEGTNCNTIGSSTVNYLNGDKVFLSYTPTEGGLLTLTTTTFVDGGAGGNNCYNDQTSLFVYEGCSNVGVNCIAGTNTTDPFDPASINNLLVQAGQTYIIVLSSQLTSGAGICFELEITSPTCAPPSDIVYSNLTQNSVSFSWDNIGGFADSWEYAVVPTQSGEPTGSGTPTATNIGNIINTGLVSATTYDLYVRSVCGGTPGAWSSPSTFTTQCTSFNVPYFTDFATATNENPEPCWTTIDANNDGVTWSFIGGYATTITSSNQYNNYDFYVSPRIIFDGTPKRIRYKHRATQGVSTYTVKLSTTGVGVDDFTTTVLPETNINNTSFVETIVDLPLGITGEVNIAWIVEPNSAESAFRFSIDDVYIEDKPTCPDPTNPFVLQITTNSAWLFWTAGESETQWEVVIQDEGSGLPTGSGQLVDTNFPYIATGLDSGRRYEFYVRAYCAADDQSEWVGPVAFTTLCESYDTPFFESFDDEDADTQKFCWDINDANNDGTTWAIDETHAYIQTSAFSPPSSFNEYLISPAINIDGVKELKYKYRADFSFFTASPRFGLEVLMSTTNTSPGSFSVISPLEIFTNSSYEEKSIIIEGSGTIYIAFRVPPEFTGSWSILSLDDVSITDAPACPNPTDLVVDTVFTDSADLLWNAGYQETAWNIVVQPAGSGVPTTSGISIDATAYSASDLSPNTEYEFYVMADCGSGTSEWIGPVTFTTLCNPYTSPFIETFNTDSDSEGCWVIINDNDDGETWELDSATFPYEGDQAAAMFTGTNGQNEDWLISPTITITENQRLRYYYRVNDSFFTEDLEVLLSTNGIGLDQFTTVLYDSDDDPVLINNVEYKVKIINFPAGITGDVNIAFHVPYFPSTGPYRGQTLVIDNVNIEDIPECPEPTNIVVSNITDTQVQVGWDANGSETAWEISVQPAGTPAPVGDTDPGYLFNADTNPFTVTGLTASTSYEIYVRAVCDGNNGEWTGPVEVLTKCSFENLCQYTFVLNSNSNISAELVITQNNQEVQALPFDGNQGDEFPLFLCSGVEFTVFFNSGISAPQYANYSFEIRNDLGDTVYSSPTGLMPRRVVYEGLAICGVVTCPQPTDLTVDNMSVLSWSPGGSETEWEVAIQPIENGTIPQSGTIVSTNSYTPTAADFSNPYAATYEFFVRAICGTDDESYWSGPYEFVRNDDVANALILPINTDEVCNVSGVDVSFTGATVSAETMSCEGTNQGDVWFEFTAESMTHIIQVNGFTGNFYQNSGDLAYPDITTTLYHEDSTGTLVELGCSYDNILLAMYASELIIGDNYKIRLTLNNPLVDEHKFKICISTPMDNCTFNLAVNGGFEEPALERLSGINTISVLQVVPGWRSNLEDSNSIFIWESLNAPGFEPYEGGQCVQLLSDQDVTISPDDFTDPKGYYRDFDTSEITLLEYSFAYLPRFDGNILQLLAGPPEGPFTLVNQPLGNTQEWQVFSGQYNIPAGQETTRFIFRAVGDNSVGNVIDAVSVVANNEIITESTDVDCTDPTMVVEANGVGTWIPDTNNPGTVTITDANSNSISISEFVYPGVYTFTWQTRYCSYDIELTYNGIGELPVIETPVEYCLNDTAQPLTATPTGTYSLIWYDQASGGTGTTTAPTPDTSVVGNTSYYVANVDENGCEGPRIEIVVTVSDSFTPELTFSYDSNCEVDETNPMPILATGFETGGTFSSSTLTVDPNTGEIDMASATSGLHDITYTYNGNSETCTLAGTYTATIEFTAATVSVTTFDYGASSFCVLSQDVIMPNLATDFTTGGSFSSGTLTVDETTGSIDLATVSVGTHDITYTVDADGENCVQGGTTTVTIEILASILSETDFSYAESIYCTGNGSILPVVGTDFTIGGSFSSTTGLVLDPETGEIDINSSTGGDYTITYQTIDDIVNCVEGNASTFDITILNSIEVAIEGDCNDSEYWLTAIAVNNSFDTSVADYTWTNSSGTTIGNNSEVFNVTSYTDNNTVELPLTISATVEYGGCSATSSFLVERSSCRNIPRGISPDGNGKNDSFDLTGYGVTSLTVYNRNGREVYSFKGNYTNQWYGQTNNGNELPDGTYFYTLLKENGSSETGWVYINRPH